MGGSVLSQIKYRYKSKTLGGIYHSVGKNPLCHPLLYQTITYFEINLFASQVVNNFQTAH